MQSQTVSVTIEVNSNERVTGSTKGGTGNTTGGDTEAFTSTEEGVTSTSGQSALDSDEMVPVATEENTVVKSALRTLLGEATLLVLVTVLFVVRKVLLTTSLRAGRTDANFSGKYCGGRKRHNRAMFEMSCVVWLQACA